MTTYELPPNPRVAIVGAGAVGGFYGAKLARHGFDVHFLLRSDYAHVRQHGLIVRSCLGDFTLGADQIRVYDDPASMPAADLVIIALKSTANDEIDHLVRPLLKTAAQPATAILTLQNGLGNEEHIASCFGADRVLGGMAFVCINRITPGLIDHSAYGHVRLGEFNRPPSPRAKQIAKMFQDAGIRCDVLDDLRYGRWEKLIWNIPFNGLSTTLDLTTDQLMITEAGEQLVRRLMAEVIAAARSQNVTLPSELIDINVNRTKQMGAYITSSHQDRRQKRRLEVEAIFGHPLRLAIGAGIPTPFMQMLYDQMTTVAAVISK